MVQTWTQRQLINVFFREELCRRAACLSEFLLSTVLRQFSGRAFGSSFGIFLSCWGVPFPRELYACFFHFDSIFAFAHQRQTLNASFGGALRFGGVAFPVHRTSPSRPRHVWSASAATLNHSDQVRDCEQHASRARVTTCKPFASRPS